MNGMATDRRIRRIRRIIRCTWSEFVGAPHRLFWIKTLKIEYKRF